MIDERSVPDILLDALTYGKTEVVVSDMDSDGYMSNKLIDRLRRHKATNDSWRYYARSEGGSTRVIVMSPRCTDPPPPTHANAKKKPVQEKPKPVREETPLAEWVLKNLLDPAKLHITVVPAEDIEQLKSVSNYETYMTEKVREAMKREDVRVMVREVTKDSTSMHKAYNARIIFGKGIE